MKHTFSKPYQFEGKTFTELDIDLDSISGADILLAKRRFVSSGGFAALLAADPEFCIFLLERVAKQPVEFFRGLPARDFCALTQAVSNFLLS